MNQLLQIFAQTPIWVGGLFVLIVLAGIQAAKPRVLPAWRLVIVPAVFAVWGVASLVLRPDLTPVLLLDWAALAAFGLYGAKRDRGLEALRIDRAAGQVTVGGSVVPLVRTLAIFFAKYAISIALFAAPQAHAVLSLLDLAISGMSAGYFIGWLWRFARLYGSRPALAADATRS